MVLGLGPGLGLGLVDAIKGARGHGDMGTRGETGLKEGVPKVDWGFSEWSSVKPAALSTR